MFGRDKGDQNQNDNTQAAATDIPVNTNPDQQPHDDQSFGAPHSTVVPISEPDDLADTNPDQSGQGAPILGDDNSSDFIMTSPDPAATPAANTASNGGSSFGSDASSDTSSASTPAPSTSSNDPTPSFGGPTPMDLPKPSTPSPAPAPLSPLGDGDLQNIKQEALKQLSPLVNHLEQSSEDRFRTTMMMLQATDDQALIKVAYEAAQGIEDDKTRAQALLDVVNEINYFTQHGSK